MCDCVLIFLGFCLGLFGCFVFCGYVFWFGIGLAFCVLGLIWVVGFCLDFSFLVFELVVWVGTDWLF